jgi:NMD protein affecting ribosome stability and mRNA decay
LLCVQCGKPLKYYFFVQLCNACLEAANKDDEV